MVQLLGVGHGGVAALALAALIGGTVLGVHAANGTFDTVTAKTLYLKDSSGKPRVVLRGKYGILRLNDSSGKQRVQLTGSNGIVKTWKSNGQVKAELGKGSGASGPHTHTATSTTTTTIR